MPQAVDAARPVGQRLGQIVESGSVTEAPRTGTGVDAYGAFVETQRFPLASLQVEEPPQGVGAASQIIVVRTEDALLVLHGTAEGLFGTLELVAHIITEALGVEFEPRRPVVEDRGPRHVPAGSQNIAKALHREGQGRLFGTQVDGPGGVELKDVVEQTVGAVQQAAIQADFAERAQGAHQHPAGQTVDFEAVTLQAEKSAVEAVGRRQVATHRVGCGQTIEGDQLPGDRPVNPGQSQGLGEAGLRSGVSLLPERLLSGAQRRMPGSRGIGLGAAGDEGQGKTQRERCPRPTLGASRELIGRTDGKNSSALPGRCVFLAGRRSFQFITTVRFRGWRVIIRDTLLRVKQASRRWLRWWCWGAATAAALPIGADTEPTASQFTDVAAASGVDFVHTNGATDDKRLPETDGSGVAFLDADGDGRQDLYFVNSGHMEGGRQGADNHLYHSVGEGRFERVPDAGGARGDAYGMGVLAGDPDNDGDADLYLTTWGRDQFYRDEGDAGFVDVTRSAGLGSTAWGSSATYLDFDNDGDLDLFVANYVGFELGTHPWCGRRDMDMRFYCDPRQYEPTTDLLYRNEGNGGFIDISAAAGISGRGNGLGVISGDFDGDGRADLYVANDMSPNFLYRNRGNGTFSENGMLSGTALSADGASQAGMGVDAGDYDRDGDLDIVVTNYQLENNTLYRNDGSYFTEASFNSGLGQVSLNYLGFGVGFFDWDNDTWLDLFVANGHVHDNIESYDPMVTYPQRAQVFRNLGAGKFVDVSDDLGPAMQERYVGRGVAFADYDEDGDVDVALSSSGQPSVLLRNDGGNAGAWLRVHLQGTMSNRDGVGAWIRLHVGDDVQFHQVRAGTGYQSTSELTAHFGLGTAAGADSLWIEWPSGRRQRLGPQDAGRTVLITEPR